MPRLPFLVRRIIPTSIRCVNQFAIEAFAHS